VRHDDDAVGRFAGARGRPMTIRVTVVVPVYNPPEPALRRLVQSLDRQTIGRSSFQAI
jgi:hypothetical protein